MAAYYCGLSPNTFDDRVKAGRFPQPHHDGRRMVWDIRELDQALDGDAGHRLDGGAAAESQSRSEIAAAEAMALAAIQQGR